MTPSSYEPSEDETCRRFVLSALGLAGWQEGQIQVQYRINNGRIRATARLHRQERPLIADYDARTGRVRDILGFLHLKRYGPGSWRIVSSWTMQRANAHRRR